MRCLITNRDGEMKEIDDSLLDRYPGWYVFARDPVDEQREQDIADVREAEEARWRPKRSDPF